MQQVQNVYLKRASPPARTRSAQMPEQHIQHHLHQHEQLQHIQHQVYVQSLAHQGYVNVSPPIIAHTSPQYIPQPGVQHFPMHTQAVPQPMPMYYTTAPQYESYYESPVLPMQAPAPGISAPGMFQASTPSSQPHTQQPPAIDPTPLLPPPAEDDIQKTTVLPIQRERSDESDYQDWLGSMIGGAFQIAEGVGEVIGDILGNASNTSTPQIKPDVQMDQKTGHETFDWSKTIKPDLDVNVDEDFNLTMGMPEERPFERRVIEEASPKKVATPPPQPIYMEKVSGEVVTILPELPESEKDDRSQVSTPRLKSVEQFKDSVERFQPSPISEKVLQDIIEQSPKFEIPELEDFSEPDDLPLNLQDDANAAGVLKPPLHLDVVTCDTRPE